MTRKVASSKRSISETVALAPSDIAARVTRAEVEVARIEERHERERRELGEMMAVAGGVLNTALREDSDDAERTRAALLRAAWVAHHRAIAGTPDPELVALRAALDRYLATRTDAERSGIEVPPLRGPRGGRERAPMVRRLLEEHVEPFVRYLRTCRRAIWSSGTRGDEALAAERAVVDVLCSALVSAAASTGLGVRPIRTAAVDAFRAKVIANGHAERLTNVNTLSGLLQAIGIDREEADQLTKRATS